MHSINLIKGRRDEWSWSYMIILFLLLHTSYSFLQNQLNNRNYLLSSFAVFAFKHFWKCIAPPEVLAFSWQALLDLIPTKHNLQLEMFCLGGSNWRGFFFFFVKFNKKMRNTCSINYFPIWHHISCLAMFLLMGWSSYCVTVW